MAEALLRSSGLGGDPGRRFLMAFLFLRQADAAHVRSDVLDVDLAYADQRRGSMYQTMGSRVTGTRLIHVLIRSPASSSQFHRRELAWNVPVHAGDAGPGRARPHRDILALARCNRQGNGSGIVYKLVQLWPCIALGVVVLIGLGNSAVRRERAGAAVHAGRRSCTAEILWPLQSDACPCSAVRGDRPIPGISGDDDDPSPARAPDRGRQRPADGRQTRLRGRGPGAGLLAGLVSAVLHAQLTPVVLPLMRGDGD